MLTNAPMGNGYYKAQNQLRDPRNNNQLNAGLGLSIK